MSSAIQYEDDREEQWDDTDDETPALPGRPRRQLFNRYTAALLALIALIASSVWRQRLRLSYEAWHVIHTVLALVLVFGALGHVLFVDEYVSSLWKQVLWTLMSIAFVALIVWVRLIKPGRARPWRLERVTADRGETTLLSLAPPAGTSFHFEPGQFGWFAIGRSPYSLTQHPFSFSSSAEGGEVELAIRALGDFTSGVGRIQPGTTVYVDGPHGVFSMDQDEGPGFGFIAGGVGIAGLISMVRTMADRQDVRPAVLFYANGDWDKAWAKTAGKFLPQAPAKPTIERA